MSLNTRSLSDLQSLIFNLFGPSPPFPEFDLPELALLATEEVFGLGFFAAGCCCSGWEGVKRVYFIYLFVLKKLAPIGSL